MNKPGVTLLWFECFTLSPPLLGLTSQVFSVRLLALPRHLLVAFREPSASRHKDGGSSHIGGVVPGDGHLLHVGMDEA